MIGLTVKNIIIKKQLKTNFKVPGVLFCTIFELDLWKNQVYKQKLDTRLPGFVSGKYKRKIWWSCKRTKEILKIQNLMEELITENTASASSARLNSITIGINNLEEIHEKIRIIDLNARIEKYATTVDETSPIELLYRTPNFRFISYYPKTY